MKLSPKIRPAMRVMRMRGYDKFSDQPCDTLCTEKRLLDKGSDVEYLSRVEIMEEKKK